MTHPAQFINGQWSPGQGTEFNSVNPANNDVIWQASAASAEQVDSAVASAREAFYSLFEKTLDYTRYFSVNNCDRSTSRRCK